MVEVGRDEISPDKVPCIDVSDIDVRAGASVIELAGWADTVSVPPAGPGKLEVVSS